MYKRIILKLSGETLAPEHFSATNASHCFDAARVDRAAELGLTCQSLWVEVEQLIWGFRNDKMDEFFEVCFCCPCCSITT